MGKGAALAGGAAGVGALAVGLKIGIDEFTEAKKVAAQTNAAIAEACKGLAKAEDIMLFIDEYPLENVAWGGRLQADRPEVVQAVAPLLASAA